MSTTLSAERLYALLPAIYRVRDEQQGGALRALVGVIARELEALEANVEQLYDDQFVETCQDWVVPYIGDLIGYRALHGVAPRVASPRAEVANTIRYRRRKGTAAMLEQLARDVTGWHARAVEFFEQLATTQYMKHVRLHAPATADLRSHARLIRCGGPFNAAMHTAEMRSPEGGSGRYNIHNVGIFLWRIEAYSLTRVPLTRAEGASDRRFRFNPLNTDTQLFRRPEVEDEVSHIAEPANVPEPIALRLMAGKIEAYYGRDKSGRDMSVALFRRRPNAPAELVLAGEVCVCDLRDVAGGWAGEASLAADKIAIDPRLGRVCIGSGVTGTFLATFHYGFSQDLGGGEYERTPATASAGIEHTAVGGAGLQASLAAITGGGRLVIADSQVYEETPTFTVTGTTTPGQERVEVVVTAAARARPLIRASGPVQLEIGPRGRLVIEGVVIHGDGLVVAAVGAVDEPRELVLRDCTLVCDHFVGGTRVVVPGELRIDTSFARVTLERCIVGALRTGPDAEVTVRQCIVDAGDPNLPAYQGLAADSFGAELVIEESTVIGTVRTRLMRLASDTLFVSPAVAERKQEGCVRFCYVPDGSVLPRRYRCVPGDGAPPVAPQFTSRRYGDPGYMQLRAVTDAAIRQGASDDGEIGVMHPLHQPQREANLRERLDEYLRFGLRAGFFYVT